MQRKLPPPFESSPTDAQKEGTEVSQDMLRLEPNTAWLSGELITTLCLFLGQLLAALEAAAPAQTLETHRGSDKQEMGLGFYSLCLLTGTML